MKKLKKNKEYSEDELSEISKYSSLLLSPAEIAIMLDFEIDDFIFEITEDNKSKAYKAFNRGLLVRKIEIREKLFDEIGYNIPEISKLISEFNSLIYTDYEKLCNRI